MQSLVFLTLFLILLTPKETTGVKHSDFRTCQQTGFCRRGRARVDRYISNASHVSPYKVDKESVQVDMPRVTAKLIDSRDASVLDLEFLLLKSGALRMRVTEPNPVHPRYDGVQDFVLVENPPRGTQDRDKFSAMWYQGELRVTWEKSQFRLAVEPFKVQLWTGMELVMEVNGKGWMEFEKARLKKEENVLNVQSEQGSDTIPEEETTNVQKETEEEKGMWEEYFGGHHDPKKRGPMSIAMDVSFPNGYHAYGLPEHATSLALKLTRGNGTDASMYSEPYRLYNLDVFEYELDSPMALYGAVPLLHAIRPSGKIASVFWMNAAETWVDITKSISVAGSIEADAIIPSLDTYWMSETGTMDLFLFPGPTFAHTLDAYTELTGRPAMPPMFAIAYHQCRWNYNDEKDVRDVDAKFDDVGIPYDVIWLDIEHTNEKRYWTWDETKFPDPKKMQNDIGLKGRKVVTIVDPHIKRDDNYVVFKEGTEQGLFVKTADGGSDYDGWCWSGSSSYLDFLNPATEPFVVNRYKLDVHPHATEHLMIWNDMNEPSVFNGPEITMPKDLVHYGGWEHRDVHNIYGLLYHKSTSVALMHRMDPPRRPFVLSRALFSGTQRWGAIWTGDNFARWDHLAASIPMISTLGLGGVPFSGADVGGFFGNPEPELLTRWYQAGAFQPFFRAHAHLDTARREPWLFGEPYTSIIRNFVRTRYRLLPYLYTQFRHANLTGMPVMRPMVMEFPHISELWTEENQFMTGPALAVRPVAEAGQKMVHVKLFGEDPWYEFFEQGRLEPGEYEVHVELEHLPVYARGGHMVVTRERARRSSTAMKGDPYTLYIFLDSNDESEGDLYLDDGFSYAHTRGGYLHRKFKFEPVNDKQKTYRLVSSEYEYQRPPAGETVDPAERQTFAESIKTERIERVVIAGLEAVPKKVIIKVSGEGDRSGSVFWFAQNSVAVIRDPAVWVGDDFEIVIETE